MHEENREAAERHEIAAQSHRKAAEQHELAAQAHRTAAEHNEKGDGVAGSRTRLHWPDESHRG